MRRVARRVWTVAVAGLAAGLAWGGEPSDALHLGPVKLSAQFRRLAAPGTGRTAVQLTTGAEACYPLYYFIPSLSRDRRYLVYSRYEKKEVQLRRLNLETAEDVPLTRATGAGADWRPWQAEPGLRGVRDYRSVLNVASNQVIYFDGNTAHAVDLESRQDAVLFELPAGREPIGQNCVTPDGRWFVYIDAPAGAEFNKPCTGARLVGYDLATRETRLLFTVDRAIHHVMPYGAEHFIVNHPPGHNGMMFTDLTGGAWRELRRGDAGAAGDVCHQLPTAAGIMYEVFGHGRTVVSGLYDPFARTRFEFRLPPEFAYTHTGFDPEGRLWFWETTGKATGHSLWYLERMDRARGGVFRPLTGDWPVRAPGQRGHFHPQLTPDRKWLLFTGGDEARRPQVFLLDVADVGDTEGVSRDLLSATGANDVLVPGIIAPPPAPAGAAAAWTAARVLARMRQAADWQLKNPHRAPAGDWIMGPFWHGLLALGRIPGNEAYLDQVAGVGVREGWRVIATRWKANDHCTPQAYLELYELRRDGAMLAPTVKALDAYIAAGAGQDDDLRFLPANSGKWSWCDALYMSPPAFARLAKVTGERKYADYLHAGWWKASAFLYDPAEKLFYRDHQAFALKEANGRKVFWSRGNGWVLGGLVRVLQCLPHDDPLRPKYEAQFRDMCGRLLELQGKDGLWPAGLLDAGAWPEPETSGSGFFVYALAYGVNEGLLDGARFRPAVLRGWSGLDACITRDGRLQYVQPVGDRPGRVKADSTLPYGVGAYLLAGAEVYRLLERGASH